MTNPITLHRPRIFRETPSVRFHDISVEGSNGIDLVEHQGRATSPPSTRYGLKQWYFHKHQTDNNRVIKGQRLFELFYSGWHHPHWFVFLDETSGALEIPPHCYHRSISCSSGSILLNHAVRDSDYDERKEFNPQVIWKAALVPPRYHGIMPCEADHFIQTGELPK